MDTGDHDDLAIADGVVHAILEWAKISAAKVATGHLIDTRIVLESILQLLQSAQKGGRGGWRFADKVNEYFLDVGLRTVDIADCIRQSFTPRPAAISFRV